ncbi:uncharacterized protein LOC110030738 [Phalaenopsis equestris]|uniref:uncharacterized protein LOC110030738 n=1 Tax=Phalaenopsis equestris TaxID=78828 RepID=UPI0009E22B77|nr:uncharacterized protein LOC110030738 [Phalaenopsis equestris]
MENYLEALDLWEAVEEDYDIPPLHENHTVAQIKEQKKSKMKKSKAKACLFSAVLNLIRGFELQKMKETENIKEYFDKLLNITNQVKLLGSSLEDSRIIQKVLVTVPERFGATITTLENTKDLTNITLSKLLSALQAQEQRRAMREEGVVEGALQVKHQEDKKNWKFKNKKSQTTNGQSSTSENIRKVGVKKDFPPCQHCGKKGHLPFRCWRRPDAKCSKCNHLGHEAVICKNENQQQEDEAKMEDQEEEDHLFVATCFTGRETSES